MPIPDWKDDVLPPFPSGGPATGSASPYLCTIEEFVDRFANSESRRKLLSGFLRYRSELRAAGIAKGYQWVNGSFVEKLDREPNDIDFVTFVTEMPAILTSATDQADFNAKVLTLKNDLEARKLFPKTVSQPEFGCDGYFLDVFPPNNLSVNQITYWYGLWSYRRSTDGWKGFVQIDIGDAKADVSAQGILDDYEQNTD